MRTFRQYLEIILNEEDAPPAAPGGAPDMGGGAPGGAPDMGGGAPGGAPDMGGGAPGGAPDMGGGLGGASGAGATPVKTKMDVYEVWRDLEEFIKGKGIKSPKNIKT